MAGMAVLLCIAMLVAAVVAVAPRNGQGGSSLPIAILSAGLVSLCASVLYVILASPDVAMTEAAIGSGLTTFLFFFVLGRVRGGEHDGDSHG